MTTLSVPSQNARVLGANPYAERVVEDPSGLRWVKTNHGWISEDKTESLRICRARTLADVEIALSSLCVAPVAQAFDQNWIRAYVVWSSPAGKPTPTTVTDAETSQGFAKEVIKRQADHGWCQWVGNSPMAWGRLRWDHVIRAIGRDGWPMGIMAGLRQRLGDRGEEWGLEGAGAAVELAGWKSGTSARSGWPTPPDGKADFHGHNARVAPAGHAAVLWAGSQRRALWSDRGLDRWFEWWARGGAGWWVTDAPSGELAKSLALRLLATGRPCLRHVIKTPTGIVEAWEIGAGARPGDSVSYSLEQWSQDPPSHALQSHPEARDGRRPYKPASSLDPSDAWAPEMLADAMEEGLSKLEALYGSVDARVAGLLHIEHSVLGSILSAEQVDAVAMASARLEEGKAFLLTDETGYGKGRVLASLALSGLAQSRTVLIVTEKKQLFADLYRDLSAVSVEKPPIPMLFHGQADIKDASGQLVVASPRGKHYQNLLKEHAWPAGVPRLIFTTYAQLARGKIKEKMAWLSERMGKGAWVLLDESHNAAGPSQVAEQVDTLIGKAAGVVHASATFVRGEGNLAAYRRALPWGETSLPWIKNALVHDPGPLRQALVEEIARAGFLLRREHAPVPPPATVWITPTDAQIGHMAAFVRTWQALFFACEQWEIAQNGRSQLAWLKIGAVMSRSVREFLLWLKAPALVDRLVELRSQGRKAVVAVDSTMEAALREAIEQRTPTESEDLPDEGDIAVLEGKGEPPLWRDRWRRLLDELVPLSPALQPALVEARNHVIEAIEQLPLWSLSPLDWVLEQASSRGVAISEISGRSTRLEVSDEGWKVSMRQIEDRTDVVRAFNGGDIDALLLTRAAASGISLHAGRQFVDQSPRTLIEWGVAADPLVRMQFWGRVRRRDQVIEPDFESMAFDTPSERRLRARDERKRKQLSSHLGASSGADIDILSPLGEDLVDEWAQENMASARRLGVARPLSDDPIGRVDRILARSMVLPEQDRTALVDRLDGGLAQGAQFWRSQGEPSGMSSRQVRRAWWWGDPRAPATRVDGIWPWRLDWVERTWLPRANTGVEQAVSLLSSSTSLDGPGVLECWRAIQMGAPTRGQAHAQQLRWAANILPSLKRGYAVQMSEPVSGQAVRAMVIDMDMPQSKNPSVWSLSQISVRLLLVGSQEALRVPLRSLAQDPQFKVAGSLAKPAWFGEDLSPVRAIVVEGNPLAAAAWGRRIGQGWSQSLHDEAGQVHLVWRMSPQYSWSSIARLPRDLMAVEQVFSFWRDYDDEPVAAALPLDQQCLAQPISGGILLKFDQNTYNKSSDEWLDAGLSKLLSSPRRIKEDGKPWVVRSLEWKMARRWFEQASVRGIGWRVSAKFGDWYEKSCRDWCTRKGL
jgi:hypothetical protein